MLANNVIITTLVIHTYTHTQAHTLLWAKSGSGFHFANLGLELCLKNLGYLINGNLYMNKDINNNKSFFAEM